jgi:hypothetical protein
VTCYRGESLSGRSRGIHRARKGSATNHEIIFRKRRRPGIHTRRIHRCFSCLLLALRCAKHSGIAVPTGIELSRNVRYRASRFEACRADCVPDEIERPLRMLGGCSMGVSDPEVRKKLSEPRWLQFKHESEKQNWPWWKRLIHRFQRCPICKPEEA